MSTLLDLQSNRSADYATEKASIPKPKFRWGSRLVIPSVVLLTGAALLVVSAWDSFIPLPEVQVETAVVKAVSESAPATTQVQAAGWLEASPYLRHVSALAGGIVQDVLVLEGEALSKGQVIARLIDDDAKLSVAQAEATLALRQAAVGEARARHAAAKASWENPIALEREAAVAEARRLEALANVAAAKARVQEQKMILEQAKRDAKRAEQLGQTSIISAQESEVAQNNVLVADAALEALQKAQQKAEAEAERMEAQARAASRDLELRIHDRRELDAAAAALQRAQAEVQVAEAVLAEARLRLNRMEIISPFDGIVVERFKDPGDKVMLAGDQPRSSTIVSVYDPSKLQVRVDVPLADAAKIDVGQRCQVISEVLPNKRFAGRVDRVLHAADIQKNTLEVKVVLEEPSPELRPEMLCRVLFMAQPRKDQSEDSSDVAVFVPGDAVRDNKLWVLVDYNGDHGIAKSVPATTTAVLDDWVAVDSLSPGDRVIVTSSTPLKDGRRVRLAQEER